MRILAVADEEVKKFYDYYRPGIFQEFDLILACGDLHREYLEFLVTMSDKPLLYVHGNHDDSFEESPPEGCICIEDQIYEYKGVRFLGLGGSRRYRPDGIHMYTEWEMRMRIWKLKYQLWRKKGFDVLVTHAPARSLGDLDTDAHKGFQCFVELLEKYRPHFLVHGHVHRNYGYNLPATQTYGDTTIINAFEYYKFTIEK